MESFRTVIKGWLGKVLLVLFLIPLALVGIEGYFSGSNKADVAKSVNGQDISNKELESATKNYKDQYLSLVKGDESLILQITKDDIMWRYFAAFGYAAVALTVIAALALLLSIFAENSIGPIISTVCIVIVCTIISNINVPIIDKNVKPWLFTSYLVGWKGFFYIGTTADGEPIKGSIENWPAIRNSLYILLAHIFILVSASVIIFKRKDILS